MSMYREFEYIEGVGASTRKIDNTREQRRDAVASLVRQAEQGWRVPMRHPVEAVADLLPMLGIEAEWLR